MTVVVNSDTMFPVLALAAWDPPELSSSAPVHGCAQFTLVRTDDVKLCFLGCFNLAFTSVANTLVNLMCSTPVA